MLFPCSLVRKNIMVNMIAEFEKEHVKKLTENKNVPSFRPGDTLRVNLRVVEGTRERIQAFEGVCIAKSNGGLHASFTVRKISYGEGVERVFPLYSPLIDEIKVMRRGKVRRAKLYYLRSLRGKAARIAEKAGLRKKDIEPQEVKAQEVKPQEAKPKTEAEAKPKPKEEAKPKEKAAESKKEAKPKAEAKPKEKEAKPKEKEAKPQAKK